MTLRVVAVLGQFRPEIGGTEIQTARLAREWASRGHRAEIWTRRLSVADPRQEAEGDAIVHRLGWSASALDSRFEKLSFSIALLWRLIRQRNEYDVVIPQQALYPAVVAAVASWVTGKPLVLRVASTGATNDFNSFGVMTKPVMSLFRARARAVVVLGRQGVQETREWGFSPDLIHTIPNGLEPTPTSSPRPERPRARVFSLGAFRPEKRVDLLLRAWEKAGSPGDLVLAGDGPLRASLEALAKELRIEATFLGTVAEPRALLRDTDVFVLPSDAEGMSNALLEAMAEGCACLATYVGGNVDCLAPHSSGPPVSGGILEANAGWLFNPGDEVAMAGALRVLCTDRPLRQRLGIAAREKIVADHALDRTAARYIDVFAGVIKRS